MGFMDQANSFIKKTFYRLVLFRHMTSWVFQNALEAQITGSPPAGRLRGVGRCARGSGSLLHSHRSNSPPCRWPERSWTDSLRFDHTPCTTCQEGSPLLNNNKMKSAKRQIKYTHSLKMRSREQGHSYRVSIGHLDSPRQTWVLQVLLCRLRPLQGGELQRRERDCCPPPQLTEHTDHWDQGSHGPTESGGKNILRCEDTTAL